LSADDARLRAVRFWFRGSVREVADVRPTMSVLQWLREVDGSTGTKEGCNQGDCGACTVVLAELTDGDLHVHTANSCLLLVPMLHGRALFTVEDLAAGEVLHPVQQAMIDHSGSQCGFCTPGFVMSLWCTAERVRLAGATLTRDEAAEAISGNLCRCTGYRPILDAAMSALATPAALPSSIDVEQVTTALQGLDDPGTLRIESASGSFLAPDSEGALAQELHLHPTARLLSGGTDLVVSMRATGADHQDDLVLLSTDRVLSLHRIEEATGQLSIGAAVSLEAGWRALVARAPFLDRMPRRFASPAIRAVGTVGGNVANASPIADLTPVLIALDAAAVLTRSEGSRTIPIAEFATGVRSTALERGEFLSRITIPMRAFAHDIRAYKVSRRFDDDISSVSAVFALELDGSTIVDLRVVLGGMATTVRRALRAESALRGREWNATALAAAQAALSEEFTPISDHRASAHYRERAAIGLLHRWWLETGADAPRVAVDLWAQA
jgi:xanthine dehydrogenase small subunit